MQIWPRHFSTQLLHSQDQFQALNRAEILTWPCPSFSHLPPQLTLEQWQTTQSHANVLSIAHGLCHPPLPFLTWLTFILTRSSWMPHPTVLSYNRTFCDDGSVLQSAPSVELNSGHMWLLHSYSEVGVNEEPSFSFYFLLCWLKCIWTMGIENLLWFLGHLCVVLLGIAEHSKKKIIFFHDIYCPEWKRDIQQVILNVISDTMRVQENLT